MIARSVLTVRSRVWLEWAVLALVLSGAIVAAVDHDWFGRLDALIYDRALTSWERAPARDIVIVAIDEASLQQIGRWPWKRSVHATLLPHFAQARAVLLDFILADQGPQDAASDDALAAAIGRHGRIVLPMHASVRADRTVVATLPADMFLRRAAAIGHIQLDADADGIVRRVYLRQGPPGAMWPHAALALREVAAMPAVASPMNGLEVSRIAADGPWTQEQPCLVAYVGGAGSFALVSYVAVLRGDVPDAFFRDKIVLVGTTSAGMGDFHPTPAGRTGGMMPGVEIIANVLQQMREGTVPGVASLHSVIAGTLAVVLMALFAGVFLPAGARLALTCALAAALAWGAAFGLHTVHVWWPPGTAIAALLAAFPLWSWRRLAAAEAFVDAELAQIDQTLGNKSSATVHGGDPLASRIGAIQRANEEIRERAREREETLSFLSHDLRSPQVSIVSLANLYRDREPQSIDAEFWRRLTGYANQTLSLADDFVQLARAGHMRTEALLPVDATEAFADAADDAWAAMQAREIRLEAALPEEAWTCADRVLLTRAFRNLIDNAVKHAPQGSAISLGIERVGKLWHCTVADAGPGVPAAERKVIFERYHIARATSAEARRAGAGLGLALVKVVAERCGGEAFVDDAPGGGARFTIALPVRDKPI